MNYGEFVEALHESVNIAMGRAIIEDGVDVGSIMLRKRYACIQSAIETLVSFAERWDRADDEDAKARAVIDSASDISSMLELLAPIISTDSVEGFYEQVGNRINAVNAIVCDLGEDTARQVAEIIDMPYDELIENHWNSHVRYADGKLELIDEAD